MQRLATETVTGLASDRGRAVGGNFSQLSAVTSSLARLEAYSAANALATTLAAGTQSALDTIDRAVGSLGTEMSDPTLTGNGSSVATLGEAALQAFEATVSAMNTRVSGQGLFAGTRTDGVAVAGADTILSALTEAVAGATTAEDVAARVSEWFASDTGFGAFYQGGAARAPAAVGDADRVAVSVTATEPALIGTLSGLAMGALLAQGVLEGQDSQRQALAQRAGGALLEADAARVGLQSRLGAAEARLADIQTRNTAEISALKIAQSDILSVDTYETATRLEAAQTQIETLYAVTARLSQMSLADVL